MNELAKVAEEQQKLYDEQKRNAEKVRQMVNSEGFTIVSQVLDKKSKELTTQLIECNDILLIRQLQADLKAIKAFIDNLVYWSSIQG